MHVFLKEKLPWFKDLLSSTKEEIREQASVLYAIIANQALDQKQFEELLIHFFNQANGKNLEAQHGAILGIANCLERKLMENKSNVAEEIHKKSLATIGKFNIHYHTKQILYSASSSVSDEYEQPPRRSILHWDWSACKECAAAFGSGNFAR